ncbi:MAG: hypothetical protein B7Y83_16685 [Flavobacteriales bacterium 32-34-25]|nr:MAG: hypothetical protein B7Y83_16685 [Flavobacteriales bacterium 32-34-25]
MKISEAKYNTIFIDKFSANETQFHSEFARIIKEYGYSEEIKIDFYKTAFKQIIKSYDEFANKNEFNYNYIANMYNIFIDALIVDNISTRDIELDLAEFISKKPSSFLNSDAFIPDNKYYNQNTKYGRKKAREQAMRNYQNGSPKYRAEQDNIKLWVTIIVLIFVAVFYWLKSKLEG